ncbi:MAG TPA: glycine betaine ABC transporter substrate-binding protein, partial [Nocardioides sp.]|nr:glycine betaine ABC transporter substrate-binding protein [Nocardioides sp.]
MKKQIIATGLALLTGLTLAGCGSNDTAADNTGGTVASNLIFGGPAEFKTRATGLPGLKDKYGVEFGKFTVTDTGGPVTVNALLHGQIDAADLFTTDPSIAANHFVILQDPKSVFAAQNIVPIINAKMATPGITSTLEAISSKLTTEGLTELVGKVQNDKEDPADVASAWLSDNGLATKGSAAAGTSLTVGSANFPENVVLAEIYAEALTDQGAHITTKLNIGSREKYFPALESGSLDLFAEYTGTALTYLDPKAT